MALILNNQEHTFDMYKEDKLEKPNYLIKVCVGGYYMVSVCYVPDTFTYFNLNSISTWQSSY